MSIRKRGAFGFSLACVYGRLLNVIKESQIPTTIKTNKLPIAGTKYLSATDVVGDSNVVDATDITWVSTLNLSRFFHILLVFA
jgi:hypothetical protein